jgi:hypothetical protein
MRDLDCNTGTVTVSTTIEEIRKLIITRTVVSRARQRGDNRVRIRRRSESVSVYRC